MRASTFWHKNPAAFCRYLLALLLFAMLFPFISVWTGLAEYLSGDPTLPRSDYAYEDSTPSADIAVFGDSTCMLGLDPRIVSASLGHSVVNLCESAGTLTNIGNYPLDFYLRKHKRPTLLVLAISPINATLHENNNYPTIYQVIRYGTLDLLKQTILSSPALLFDFWKQSLTSEVIRSGLVSRTYWKNRAQIRANSGWMPNYNDTRGLRNCVTPPQDEVAWVRRHAYIDSFMEEYRRRNIEATVFFTPVPDCDCNLGTFQLLLRGLAGNQPYAIDRALIAAEPANTSHPLLSAVPGISLEFARVIKPIYEAARLRSSAAKPTQTAHYAF